MLILLPPSEGKSHPRRGPELHLDSLSFPALTPTRERVLSALGDLCSRSPAEAARVLGLGPTQFDDVQSNTTLRQSPCAHAIRVYSGVLFDALDYATLSAPARRRAQARVAISSGLWGLVRLTDRIPGYRLSGSVALPGLGTLASAWREPVASEIAASTGIIIDLRSSTYASLGPIPKEAAARAVVVRVLQERDGVRTIVSHMNKATKGRILRASLESDSTIRNASDLLDGLRDWGFVAEAVHRRPGPSQIDVVVTEL
ncbi:MAG: peroxide stress protein YaaA [bacterium]|nr:peroxide stress protein YaaA [bacterium]